MRRRETWLRANMVKEEEDAAQAIAAMIRQSSEAGQLISESEILRRVTDQHLLTSYPADPAEEVRKHPQESS